MRLKSEGVIVFYVSENQLRSFLEAVISDSALEEKLKDAAQPDDVAAIAHSAGFESISPELVADFLEYVSAQSASEPEGEQELSAVSGGLSSGAIVGIASGAVAGVGVIAGATYLAYQAHSEQQFMNGIDSNLRVASNNAKTNKSMYDQNNRRNNRLASNYGL